MKHVLLRNPRLSGIQYGILRAMEQEIVAQTGAEIIDIPFYGYPPLLNRIGYGMRWDFLRNAIPAKSLSIEADVIWHVLMGPENYELDLYKGWNLKAKTRIVYLFDTLEEQFPLMKRLFSSDDFNVRITSFKDAVPALQQITGRNWHAVEQAVPESIFQPVPAEKRVIDFSSYGRKLDSFHLALKEFCESENLYYDYTTQNGRNLTVSQEEAYRQYAWHVSHSMFTVAWPVELTSPARAGRLNPITCRWFEAASVGTPILGRKPNNPDFDELLAPGLVIDMDPYADKRMIWVRLGKLYENRMQHLEQAGKLAVKNMERWGWRERVQRILKLVMD